MAKEGKVVVITGANSGIGYALAERLLALHTTITICLACRNLSKAELARDKLAEGHPEAKVETIQLDTSSVRSVTRAAEQLQQRYSQIDYLYLNAGIYPDLKVDWKYLLWCHFHPTHLLKMWVNGEGVLQATDNQTEDGLAMIFATNLFGHFLLVRKLEEYLCSSGSRIIWTSSSNGMRKHFSMDDFQHRNGTEPYSSSKHGINLISNAINDRCKERGVYSHVICPGFCLSGITNPIMGSLFWTLLYPLMFLLRWFVPSLCLTPWNSAEALVWLFKSDPDDVDPKVLHVSNVSMFGPGYVGSTEIEFEPSEASIFYDKLVSLQADLEENINEG